MDVLMALVVRWKLIAIVSDCMIAFHVRVSSKGS